MLVHIAVCVMQRPQKTRQDRLVSDEAENQRRQTPNLDVAVSQQVTQLARPPATGHKPRQPLDRLRYHRAPGPLRCNDATCTFLDGHAIITYCYQGFGDKSVITDTYGMDYDDVMRQHGLAPYDRANKVRVLPIDWFYN